MSSDAVPPLKPYQVWLVLIVASVGFLFDTYELLMLPVIAAPDSGWRSIHPRRGSNPE